MTSSRIAAGMRACSASRAGLQHAAWTQPGCSRRRVAAGAKAQRKRPQKSSGGGADSKGFGSQRQPSSIQVADLEAKPAAEQQQQRPVSARGPSSSAAVQLPHTNSAGSPEPTSRSNSDGGSFSVALPAVSRGQVLATCTQISLLLAAAGLGLHELTPLIPPALRVGQEEAVQALLQWPPPPTLQQLGIALAAAAAVTGTRVALLAAWPDFREASERSNQQVLSPLAPADLLVVSLLPGLSEELLFRGGLIPAIAPDWRGVLIAGLTFGALHTSGGRNAAFAAWASAVGCAYGFLFIATGSLWVPALAHSAANLASAALWKARHSCTW